MLNRAVFNRRFLIMLALVCIASAVSMVQNLSEASADESSSSTPVQVSVGLQATGYTDGTTTSLEKKVYFSGDTINLNWRGAESGTDLIIPISITYGSNKIDIGALNKIESLQTENTQYKERMGQNGTMTEYETLKNYVLSDHSVSLGSAVDGLNIYINYARVSPVYRLYNMVTSEHLFSTNKDEYDRFVELCKTRQDVWIGEGIDWLAPTTADNTKVVHRLYNEGLGSMGHSSHYYTSDETEIANLIANHGWVDDGADVQYRSGGSTPIYTCYNEALKSAHHYTSSKTEWEGLEAHGWALERDKNGSNGVFQCLTGTSWTFADNFYKVEHYKQNLDGSYSLAETQYMAGKAGDKTLAVAQPYAGYTAGDITQKTILNDDSTTVRINYSRQSYNLVLDGNDKAETSEGKEYQVGEKIGEPAPLTSEGQDFTGWYLDPACQEKANFDTLTMPSDGLTLFAGWKDKDTANYTVTHVFQKTDGNWPSKGEDGYVTETKNGMIGAQTTAEQKTETGFQVVEGWSQSTISSDGTTEVRIEYTRNKHYMTFSFNGRATDPEPVEVYYGQEIQTPEIPSEVSEKFAGWYTTRDCDHDTHWGHDGQEARLMPDSEFTLYAHWTDGNVLWVTFETNGGTPIVDEEVVAGETMKVPSENATTRTGWTFEGWYNDYALTEPVDFAEPITKSKTIYAKWSGNSGIDYVVRHVQQNANGTFDDPVVVEEKKKGTAGKTATVEIQEIEGFEKPTAPVVEIQGDGTTVVTVNYSRKAYNIKFNANGHGIAPETKTGILFGATVIAPTPEPTETGWIFEGWYQESTFENEWIFGDGGSTMPNNDVELFAKWKIESYTVTFDTDGGSAENSQTVNFGSRAERPSTEPTKAGHTFVNWYKAGKTEVFDFATEITGDTTIYAVWEDLSKGKSNTDGKVTLYDKGSGKTIHAQITYDADGDATTGEVPLESAYFEIDDQGKMTVKLPAEPDATGLDVTVTLTDEAGNPVPETKKVEAVDNDDVSRGEVDSNEKAQALFAGKNRGKTTDDGKIKLYDPSTGKQIEAFIEYEKDGVLTPLSGATVEVTKSGQVNVAGTTDSNDATVKITLKDVESGATIDERPVKWTDDGQTEARGTKNTDAGVVTFTFFTLTYNTDGGTEMTPQKVSEGKAPIKPENPTKSGVYFMGWYEQDKTTLYDFSQALTENKTIYAVWTEGTYTVIFNKNDELATGEMTEMSRKIGDNKQLTGNGFSKVVDGVVYGMKYWTTNPDGSGLQYRDKYLGDLDLTQGLPITLYAQWTTVDINPYWIAASTWKTTSSSTRATNIYYTNPETSVVKTQSQIQEDMRILSDTAHEKYSQELYDETLALYTSYMENDDYHLYTKLTETQSNSVNDYAEFRIIQVGNHEAIGDKTDNTTYSDGAILTFEQTHLLPQGYKLFENSSNAGGWKDTALRTRMNSGDVFALFNTAFTDDVSAIEKWNRRGSVNGSVNNDLYTTADKLWITSAAELTVSAKASYSSYKLHCEGETYWFWKNRGVTGFGGNTALSQFCRRDGTDASGASPRADWWTRSPYPGRTNSFGYVGSPGYPMWGDYPSRGGSYIGLVVCFAFDNPDTSIVHFETDWGTNIEGQTVANGSYATLPTKPVKDGYNFLGWYDNATFEGEAFNFETTAITKDVTLYAKWEAVS